MLSVTLSRIVLPLRISRPIQREPVAHQPLRNVNAINRTYRNRATVSVQADRRAMNRPSRYEGVKLVRGLRAASVLQALIVATELGGFGRIYSPKANARAV